MTPLELLKLIPVTPLLDYFIAFAVTLKLNSGK
jgi:hypothetical protein